LDAVVEAALAVTRAMRPESLPWLPIVGTRIVDPHTTGGELREQPGYRWRDFSIARDAHRPLQIFAELPGADPPLSQRDRRLLGNLYDRPVTSECEGGGAVWQRSVHDEMIVADNQDADHGVLGLKPRIVNGAANREVVDHLLRERTGILARIAGRFAR
jgi:hypothetical protein